ncbi:hypothetical protein H5410_007495 [Solanum commersonii]|uniref:Uncharacterized protein n=1 Tax=Solanum commersonii TaxID=4109 RepID=A0A9J6AC93_SOLCO|nr:hypothetical protein H5410_007495 [Solanum commersonii]
MESTLEPLSDSSNPKLNRFKRGRVASPIGVSPVKLLIKGHFERKRSGYTDKRKLYTMGICTRKHTYKKESERVCETDNHNYYLQEGENRSLMQMAVSACIPFGPKQGLTLFQSSEGPKDLLAYTHSQQWREEPSPALVIAFIVPRQFLDPYYQLDIHTRHQTSNLKQKPSSDCSGHIKQGRFHFTHIAINHQHLVSIEYNPCKSFLGTQLSTRNLGSAGQVNTPDLSLKL